MSKKRNWLNQIYCCCSQNYGFCLTRGVCLKIGYGFYLDRVIPFDQFAQRSAFALENSLPRRFVQGQTIFKMILLLILSNDPAPQSLIQAPRTGVVFLNGNEERYLLLASLVLQLFNQGAPNVLVLICG